MNPQKGGPKYGFGGSVIELPVLLTLMPKLRFIKRGSKGYQKFWVGNLLNHLIRRKNPKVYQKFRREKGCISSIYYKYITHLYLLIHLTRGWHTQFVGSTPSYLDAPSYHHFGLLACMPGIKRFKSIFGHFAQNWRPPGGLKMAAFYLIQKQMGRL